MKIHELNNTLWFNTPHGIGIAILLIDYGIHQNTIWVIANQTDGRIRHYDSNDIFLCNNQTLNINHDKESKQVYI